MTWPTPTLRPTTFECSTKHTIMSHTPLFCYTTCIQTRMWVRKANCSVFYTCSLLYLPRYLLTVPLGESSRLSELFLVLVYGRRGAIHYTETLFKRALHCSSALASPFFTRSKIDWSQPSSTLYLGLYDTPWQVYTFLSLLSEFLLCNCVHLVLHHVPQLVCPPRLAALLLVGVLNKDAFTSARITVFIRSIFHSTWDVHVFGYMVALVQTD